MSTAIEIKQDNKMVRPFKRTRPMAHERDPDYKRGRPSLYREKYCDMVVKYMAKGYTLTAFAGSIRVSRDTVQEWIAQHSDFSVAVTRGKAAASNAWESRLMHADKSAQAATSIFALKNVNPDDWKEVRHNNLEVTHKLEQMTDAQLLAIMQGKSVTPHVVLDARPLELEHVKGTTDSYQTPTRRKD